MNISPVLIMGQKSQLMQKGKDCGGNLAVFLLFRRNTLPSPSGAEPRSVDSNQNPKKSLAFPPQSLPFTFYPFNQISLTSYLLPKIPYLLPLTQNPLSNKPVSELTIYDGSPVTDPPSFQPNFAPAFARGLNLGNSGNPGFASSAPRQRKPGTSPSTILNND